MSHTILSYLEAFVASGEGDRREPLLEKVSMKGIDSTNAEDHPPPNHDSLVRARGED